MQQIVISPNHSGFSLDDEIVNRLRELCHVRALEITTVCDLKGLIPDDDPLLIKVTKQLTDSYVEPPSWNDIVEWLRLKGHPTIMKMSDIYDLESEIARDDPLLVQVVSGLIEKNEGDQYADLVVIEIPDGVEWEINEYDGSEWVAEKHRTWQYKEIRVK